MSSDEPDVKPSEVERPSRVWWSPTAGVVLRHPDEPEQYVAVDGRNGEYLDQWPTDSKQLRAEHPDWHARALMWERMADSFGKACDERVADAEQREARAKAEVATERARYARLNAAMPVSRDLALRDVDALLRDMHVNAGPDGRLRDRLWLTDDSPMSTRSIADLAALIVDRVLGAEHDEDRDE